MTQLEIDAMYAGFAAKLARPPDIGQPTTALAGWRGQAASSSNRLRTAASRSPRPPSPMSQGEIDRMYAGFAAKLNADLPENAWIPPLRRTQ